MRHSKLFLSLTAVACSVAAFAAVKASRATIKTVFYITKVNGTCYYCNAGTFTSAVAGPRAQCQITTQRFYLLYTNGPINAGMPKTGCTVPAYFNAQ